VDVRIIAATHQNVFAQVSAGGFRQDLFHRVGVGIIELPPLRERGGDLPLLIDLLWAKIQKPRADSGSSQRVLSNGAKNILCTQPWPGNVRELDNVLSRIDLWSTGATITKADAEEALLPLVAPEQDGILGRNLGDELDLKDVMGEVAKHYLNRALQEAGGNRAKAARLLGMSSRNTLNGWLSKHGVGAEPGELS
jgi:DNA-binding NtrC family response regulator